jgi:hypothetical protein
MANSHPKNNNPRKYNDLTSWLNNYFSVVIIIVLFLFLALAYWLIISPKFISIQNSLQTKVREQETLYTIAQSKLFILEDIQKVYGTIEPGDLQKFNSVLPTSYVPDRLYGQLEEIVASGGWMIQSIEFDSEDAKVVRKTKIPVSSILTDLKKYPGLEKYNVSLSISTIDYLGVKRLLHLLETNLRLLDVTSVDFSPEAGTAVLNLNTYYYLMPR